MIHKETYTGEYRGIKFELVLWGQVEGIGKPYAESSYCPIWNLYLMIDTKRIPEENNPSSFLLQKEKNDVFNLSFYDYDDHPILSSIDFHGGITFYETLEDGWIKVGCDYNHFGDHQSLYSFEHLLQDAGIAIDSFLEMIPGYKMWCSGNGKLYDKNEGVIRNNAFYSREYWSEDHPEWFSDNEEKEAI
ncbi:MAG: hypothetical protein WCQ90_08005 [Deltaproteobacteria bacterium]